MNEIRFTVHSLPVAQPRQRHRGFIKNGNVCSMNYTPAKHPVNAFKAAVQLAAAQAYQGAPLDCPLIMDVTFVFPRRKTTPKRITERQPHIVKPDRENLIKGLQDAMNGLTYRDDKLIYDGPIRKFYAAIDEQPHVEVVIYW